MPTNMNFKVSILPDDDNTYSLGSAQKKWKLNGGGAGSIDVDAIYPIGAIYMSVDSTSPATLFGGTWEAIENTFLVAQGTNFTAGTSGGSSTITLQTTNLPSHTHEVGAHAHGLNSHTHTGPSHTHTGPSHTHGLNGHTHSGPNHSHGPGSLNGFLVYNSSLASRSLVASGNSYCVITCPSNNIGGLGYSGSTANSGTGATGGNSGNTTAAGTGATGAAGTGNTGAATGNTANSTAFNSGATGSGTAINILPPYLAVYMWKRTG